MSEDIHDHIHKAVAPAAVSANTATISFFADTLPVLQWVGAVIAIISGVLGSSWAAYQFYYAWKARRVR